MVKIIKNLMIIKLFAILFFFYPGGAFSTDFSFEQEFTVYKVEFIKPTADQKFVFDSSSSGKLEIECEAKVTPDTQDVRNSLENKIVFDIDSIGSSSLTWDNAGGVAKYSGGVFKVKATFESLPNNNDDFGDKNATMYIDGVETNRNVKIFYPATATNHPSGTASDPNWFYYYKQNAGGGAYSYTSTGRSNCTRAGGDSTIRIGNEAYAGDEYITTTMVGGQLTATGWSTTNTYYANFLGVLAHERQHANNEVTTGPPLDPDNDWLSTDFENNTSNTDPADKYSARGSLTGSGFSDDEIYAGGTVEQAGIQGADTSNDWAAPGTNY